MPVEVCGFVLPDEIATLADDERWTAYTEQERLPAAVVAEVFGEEPDPTWKIYGLEEMRSATEEWHREDDPQWFGSAPHNIEGPRSVLIGELGYDRPFALDFRSEHPVVRFMTVEGHWVVVAASAAAFVDALGIEGGCS
ncbi:MAG: hypothetical protein GY701_16480 [Sulfitobacter sp.]|nr:hypothetical protein [Sulfitobacter sp.]